MCLHIRSSIGIQEAEKMSVAIGRASSYFASSS